MDWRRFILPVALILAAMPGLARATEAMEHARPGEGVPEQRRVMVMLELTPEHYRSGSGYGGAYGDAMGQKTRLKTARKIARDHRLTLVENWPMERIGVDCVIMEIRDARSIDAVVAELSAVPGVAWSQPLNEFRVQGSSDQTYNDKLFRAQAVSTQWHLARLHQFTTGRGVRIAIVDSRIDTDHPDLAGQITATPDFVTARRASGERHGTGVAGIIAARPNNAIGIVGVAPGATVLGLRACWEKGDGSATVCDSLSLAKALVYALDARADVINLSLTGPSDKLLETLVLQAIGRGVTVVAAVAPGSSRPSFPAVIAGVIPVGDELLSKQMSRAYIAPGQRVLTTEPEGKWNIVTGSSYAAAHVSGLAALLKELAGKRGARRFSPAVLGQYGPIDACAAIARISSADARPCH